MTRPLPTSERRAVRDALAGAILAAFEPTGGSGLLDDLHALLADPDARVVGERAARLAPLADLVRVTGTGAARRAHLLSACEAARPDLLARVEQAREAVAAHRARRAGLPGTLGVAAALLAAGLFFEVHEVLEQTWQTLAGTRRRFYQGVIQLAVALHHLAEGRPASAARLFAAGRDKLVPLAPVFEGVDVARLLAGAAPWEDVAAADGPWPAALELPALAPR